MFRTWIIRQRNTVRVHKLTDIATCLDATCLDSKLVSWTRSYSDVIHVLGDLFNNIIFGINESMKV